MRLQIKLSDDLSKSVGQTWKDSAGRGDSVFFAFLWIVVRSFNRTRITWHLVKFEWSLGRTPPTFQLRFRYANLSV